MRRRVSKLFILAANILVLAIPANSQENKNASNAPGTAKAGAATIRLGTSAVVIPAPEGYEEATSQFEGIKAWFSANESSGTEILLGHLMSSDCELLRRNQEPTLEQYTKVSVLRIGKEQQIPEADFVELVSESRKNGTSIMDLNDPKMKTLLENVEKRLKNTGSPDASLDMSQTVNMGELEVSPNNYSVMLMLPFKVSTGQTPLLCVTSFLRLQQRIVYVYTYRTYHSKADVDALRAFTKTWTSSILAAN